MRCVYLSHNYRNFSTAGNQAKRDMECVMEQMGFINIGLPRSQRKGVAAHFFINLAGVARALLSLRRGDVLFLQYPLKKYFTALCRVARLRGARVVALVHDLGSCRRSAITVARERKRLSHAHLLITGNDSMSAHILQHIGLDIPMVPLRFWDNLTPGVAPVRTLATEPSADAAVTSSAPLTVAYAGALNPRKNGFLPKWGAMLAAPSVTAPQPPYRVNLYGNASPELCASLPASFTCRGFVAAEELTRGAMEGHFGLVWDGDSTTECLGSHGAYLALNTPHKVSLYVRCHLPVIIWRGAALATFVEEQGIGFTVESLAEIGPRLSAVTPERYALYQQAVTRLDQRVRTGHYFRTAATAALASLHVHN